MSVDASDIDAPQWDSLLDDSVKVSNVFEQVITLLPGALEKIRGLTKSQCLAMVKKLEEDGDHKCGDVDKEARLKLLIEMQQVVQGFVLNVVEVIDVHEELTAKVDGLISLQLEK